MSYLKKLFRIQKDVIIPEIDLGRYSDSYKEEEKYEFWDKAIMLFESKEYINAFLNFLEYLKNDMDNLNYTRNQDVIDFELFQGSKKIVGRATKEKVTATAKIAKTSEMNIGFMRKLIEQNFNLKYSKYSLDEEDSITLTFTSYMLDGSPYKLYYALKELSVNADKQDDILLEEFDALTPVNTGHIRNVSDDEKAIKYEYLQKELAILTENITEGKLDPLKYPGGISYLILSVIYKLDFLIHPEGATMEGFEKIHKAYFLKDGKSADRRNHDMLKKLRKIQERTQEQFNTELYGVKSTFGITAPTSHERVKELIDDELSNIDWYMQNHYGTVAEAIPSYIVGYCLFNYSIPLPIKKLFILYYQIFENDYFTKLGFPIIYWQNFHINKAKVKSAIFSIENSVKAEFPNFKPDVKKLVFSTPAHFGKSFMLMIRDVEVKKTKKKQL